MNQHRASPLPLTLRAAGAADAPAVRELIFEILDEYGLPRDPSGADADLADLDGNYLRRGGVFEILQTADRRVVGSVAMYPMNASEVELRKMYLHPNLRGRGLGRYLLHRMLVWAGAQGYAQVSLETATPLAEAIGLYRNFGFRFVAEDPATPRCDQRYVLSMADWKPGAAPPLYGVALTVERSRCA